MYGKGPVTLSRCLIHPVFPVFGVFMILLCTPQIKSCRSTTLFEIAETKNIVVLRLYQTSSTRK